MGNDLKKNNQPNILMAISDLVANIGLNDAKTNFNSKTGTASVTGNRDGIQYTTTLKKQLNGMIQTSTQFATNLSRDALKSQIKDLKRQGYTQQEIAGMLNISQPTVSKYLRS